MKIAWTRPALRDLEAVVDCIAKDNPLAAAQIVERVFAQAESLAQYPHLGRAGRVAGTRELVVTATPFIVPYRVCDERVEILAVFHGARKWPEGF
ncbi:MAG: type II toxin-antitoxin system RelE/ParE family toxin [Proteobacteria bacterium]|nr:type II toxin-antitoxin system RelE/ParE family toxin [Pseudomonadota bacterium]